ncbi:MAG: NmrA family NAD(P)-binding protein [Bacteroidota bacterium]
MNNTILVAGATGNLGGKIVNALIRKGADVRIVVRLESSKEKIEAFIKSGVTVYQIDMANSLEMKKACEDVSCVVSALAGLHETIIDAQLLLLNAAIAAGVPRFIPSDFSTDFTNLIPGRNRNLDLRRDFHKRIEHSAIKVTTIFNGPFMDLLTGDMPLILFKMKRVLYWGNPHVKMDFTTTYNVAEYTASAALDNTTPRYLKIAGDIVSATDIKDIVTQITGKKFGFLHPGGIGLLNAIIKMTKFFTKQNSELYPPWQGMQYMRDMMEGRVSLEPNHNDRYPVKWTSVKEYLISENIDKKLV